MGVKNSIYEMVIGGNALSEERILFEPDCPLNNCRKKAVELCKKCGSVLCEDHVNNHEKKGVCSIQ